MGTLVKLNMRLYNVFIVQILVSCMFTDETSSSKLRNLGAQMNAIAVYYDKLFLKLHHAVGAIDIYAYGLVYICLSSRLPTPK